MAQPAAQQMDRCMDRTDAHALWSDGGQLQPAALHCRSNTTDAQGMPDTGNLLVKKDQFSGVVPQDWKPDARLERISATDAAADALHKSVDADPSATINVSAGCLLPGEKVLSEMVCLGFVNFPNPGEKVSGDCRLVLTQGKDGSRRLMMVANAHTNILEATEFYDGVTSGGGCCKPKKTHASVNKKYVAERSGESSFGIVSVDSQVLFCTSDVITKTQIETAVNKSNAWEKAAGGKCCALPGCKMKCFCGCIPCPSFDCSVACKSCCPEPTATKVSYSMSAKDEPKTLEDIVTRKSEVVADGLKSSNEQTRYYGLNLVYADPAKQKLVELIAIAHPQTGQQQLAAFVANVMHDLRAPEIYEKMIEASRDLRETAVRGAPMDIFGGGGAGGKAGGKDPMDNPCVCCCVTSMICLCCSKPAFTMLKRHIAKKKAGK